MKNTKILEMLNNGKIEELKKLLEDEVYQDSLKTNGNAKQRYAAMKRYFRYAGKNPNIALNVPCENVEVNGNTYNSFVDGYTVVLTTEGIGEIKSFDKSKGDYFHVEKMFDFSGNMEKINLNVALAEAKAKGYKYKKSELGNYGDFQYVFKYKNGYYKVGLFDQAYNIINDGEEAEIYYISPKSLLIIKTSIGICGILPFNFINGIDKTIIDIENLSDAA